MVFLVFGIPLAMGVVTGTDHILKSFVKGKGQWKAAEAIEEALEKSGNDKSDEVELMQIVVTPGMKGNPNTLLLDARELMLKVRPGLCICEACGAYKIG